MEWAYPLGAVTFPRLVNGVETDVPHHAQQWYACGRCRQYIDRGDMAGLAELLGRPEDYFDPLERARIRRDDDRLSPGYPWRRRIPTAA